MALFKISKGLKANLPSTKTEGYCYYTTDDSLFYIDYKDSNGTLQRKALNAQDAETLTGASLATILNSSDIEIPTSKAVLTAIANKADKSHVHDDKYYIKSEVDTKISGKSDTDHTHSNYVPTSRTVNGKALSSNITLSAAEVGALPDSTEIPSALADLTADSTHRTVTDTEKATWNAKSNFSGSYNDLTNKPTIPSIAGLATTTYVDDVAITKVDKVSGKGLSTNDYTTTEKNKLSGIATGAEVNQNAFSNVVVGSTTISADSKTDSLTIAAGTGISVSGDATNDKVTITNSGVRSISTGSADGTISVNTNGASADVAVKGLGSAAYTASTAYDAAGTAQTKADAALASAKSYADGIKNDLLNGAGAAYDTLKELGDLIDTNVDAIDALETVAASKANASDLTSHTGNKSNPHGVTLSQLGVTATAAELNIMDGVTATTAEINKLDGLTATTTELNYVDGVTSNIQTQLDGKAASSHGTHVSYSNTAPVMDGTASVGSANTVARSDHKHPTDTSRAAKTDLDTHTSNTTVHITSTERTNWGTAYTHSQAAHAPSNAQANQNAFSNIAVSGQTTVAADTTTDTVTFVGSNVTITTDATNDKVTFTVADGSTSAKGIVQLTNSTSSTSTTTAATPSSVKSAYDLANTAKTNAATAQTKADSAYNLAENIVYVGPTAPTDPSIKVWINTSEEGTGVVPVLPRVATITLAANAWIGTAEPYSQPVTVATATSSSKVDLQPTAQQIVALQNADISLMIENNGGALTCYAIGGKPTVNYTMQVLVQEVAYV